MRLRDYSSCGAVNILMDADMPPLAKAGFYSCECQNPLPSRPIFEKFKGLENNCYVISHKEPKNAINSSTFCTNYKINKEYEKIVFMKRMVYE
jgi:hypothetical protein